MMPFLPILVFGSLFIAFSGQTLFGASPQTTENATDDGGQDEDNVVAIKLTEADLADAIAIYIKPKDSK